VGTHKWVTTISKHDEVEAKVASAVVYADNDSINNDNINDVINTIFIDKLEGWVYIKIINLVYVYVFNQKFTVIINIDLTYIGSNKK